jgi:hypothetical protein
LHSQGFDASLGTLHLLWVSWLKDGTVVQTLFFVKLSPTSSPQTGHHQNAVWKAEQLEDEIVKTCMEWQDFLLLALK